MLLGQDRICSSFLNKGVKISLDLTHEKIASYPKISSLKPKKLNFFLIFPHYYNLESSLQVSRSELGTRSCLKLWDLGTGRKRKDPEGMGMEQEKWEKWDCAACSMGLGKMEIISKGLECQEKGK